MVQEARILEAYRLAKDFSWPRLSATMKKHHAHIPPTTLQYLLKRAPEGSCPRDRTLIKLRRFLSWARRHDGAAMQRARAILAEQQQHEQEQHRDEVLV